MHSLHCALTFSRFRVANSSVVFEISLAFLNIEFAILRRAVFQRASNVFSISIFAFSAFRSIVIVCVLFQTLSFNVFQTLFAYLGYFLFRTTRFVVY